MAKNKEKLLTGFNIVMLILTFLMFIFTYQSLDYVKKQIDWTERELNVDVNIASYQSLTGMKIKEMCNDEYYNCFEYPLQKLKDDENYNLAFFTLINLGDRTLRDIDINIRCNNCNFSLVVYDDKVISKKASIHLPYSVYVSLEKLPPTNSFEQSFWLVWQDGDDDNWWVQYSSYEIKKRERSIEIKKDGKFIEYVTNYSQSSSS